MPQIRGNTVPTRWSLVRREAERILADGQWHTQAQLRARLSGFVDPRMAARAWVRDYERHSRLHGMERASGAEVLRGYERQALRMGAGVVINDMLRNAVRTGRFEERGPRGQRCYRLRPQPGAANQAVA